MQIAPHFLIPRAIVAKKFIDSDGDDDDNGRCVKKCVARPTNLRPTDRPSVRPPNGADLTLKLRRRRRRLNGEMRLCVRILSQRALHQH